MSNNGAETFSSLRVQDGELEIVEAVSAELDTLIDISFLPDYRFLYALSTGHLLSDDLALHQPAIFVPKIRCNCSLSLVEKETEGIPTKAESVPDNLGVIDRVVGLAVSYMIYSNHKSLFTN
eukprot:4284175-Ditylum_brightwellii.AAC.1